jgi:hypothetical protein
MAPSSTQKGINANTLAPARCRIIPSNTSTYSYNGSAIFSPTTFNFARGKVFPATNGIFTLQNTNNR